MAPYSQYKVPPKGTDESQIIGWVREAVQEGQRFLQQQRAYADLTKCFDIITGDDDEKLPSYRSSIRSRRTKRQAREIVGTLCDLRNVWQYRSDNADFQPNGNILNKLNKAWWQNTFADRGLREVLQYGVVGGTGYAHLTWQNDYHTYGRGDIVLEGLGPQQVVPIQLPSSNNLQQAYAVVLIKELPIALAHALYPEYAARIVPDRDAPSMLKKAIQKMSKFMAPVLNRFGPGGSGRSTSALFPTVDIFQVYIMDRSINESGAPVVMGKPGTSWCYTVPPIGGDVYVSKDPKTGATTFRKADRQDAMLYPMRRLIVATNTCQISDDSSPWWHGMVPAVPFRTDDWPWEFLGLSIVKDGAEHDKSLTRHMRNIDDVAEVRLRPPLQYDKAAVSKSDMEKLDTRRPNTKIGVDLQMGEAIKPLLPFEFLEVPGYIPEFMQMVKDDQDYMLATKDIAAFAKARAMPAGDMQQIEEFAGPIVKDISRGMERGLREVGVMWKYMAFQFYNVSRRVQLLGDDGFTKEDFDFTPGSMIPSHMPWEQPNGESSYNVFERARKHAENFYYYITPGSLHQITQMSQKLLYLQLQRSGFPIDPWTIAEIMDVSNFGPAPKGTSSVMERWVAWQRMQVERAIETQQKMSQIQAAAQAGADPAVAAANIVSNAVGGGGQGEAAGHNQPGRPPTAQKPPHIVQKDGGSRSTIAES